ncbi:hypothetical protein [Rhodanobacter sp. OR87]|uniref:hypothetical protein n=1 Tax=Rhodanobacter sp. OR87 TaxID=1076523 RepID=UPI0003FC8471|nr:hypothetical protein [Rhodanobacter sp. OR87]
MQRLLDFVPRRSLCGVLVFGGLVAVLELEVAFAASPSCSLPSSRLRNATRRWRCCSMKARLRPACGSDDMGCSCPRCLLARLRTVESAG